MQIFSFHRESEDCEYSLDDWCHKRIFCFFVKAAGIDYVQRYKQRAVARVWVSVLNIELSNQPKMDFSLKIGKFFFTQID